MALVGGVYTEVAIGSVAPTEQEHPNSLRGRLGRDGVDFAFSRVEGELTVSRAQTMGSIDIRL